MFLEFALHRFKARCLSSRGARSGAGKGQAVCMDACIVGGLSTCEFAVGHERVVSM